MSRIDELLKDEKIEWKSLGEVCEIFDYMRKPITKSKRKSGKYPYYGANGIQDYVDDYIFDGTYILMGEDGSVITKNGTPVLHWVNNKKFWVNNHAHVLGQKEEKYNLKYIYYYLSTCDVKSIVKGTPPKINQENMRNIRVAIPSLETQEKIVKILDKFTEYVTELQAELQQRTKQYEYYRDLLLSEEYLNKKSMELCGEGSVVEWKSLGEISLVTKLAGYEFTKYVRYSDNGEIIALRGLNVKKGKLILDDIKYIDNSDFSKLNRSKLYFNDILFTYVGTVGEVGLVDEDNKYYLAPNVSLIRIHNQKIYIPKYILYSLQSNHFIIKQMNKLLSSSSMKNLTMEKIRLFKIPIPPLEVQEYIVLVLDKFDKLINDIKEGLPREIELRQKQYEYYREKLLSF